jgi:UDP-2,3-diacylglucosamine pyrophosphatase LpxH
MFVRRMSTKFNRIYREARKPENVYPLDLEKDRLVFFSDHHKGDGSAADDFKKNAALYDNALAFYQREGFRLVVVGDNEELWEASYDQILSGYRELIKKEIAMSLESRDGKKIRIYGNHDKEVSLRGFKKYCSSLEENILKNVDHREGLCLGQDIFLIHGHQGRFFEDQAWRLSRWAIQIVWKTIQMILDIGIDGPAENYKIRDSLELKYYRWAKKHKLLLICGHTHRAIFGSLTHQDRLQPEILRLSKTLQRAHPEEREDIQKEIERSQADIKALLSRRAGKKPKTFEKPPAWPVPCYFNDGCCGYTNGITCIEIDSGVIRLIKWQQKDAERIPLVEKRIQPLLRYIKERRPVDKHLEPELFGIGNQD